MHSDAVCKQCRQTVDYWHSELDVDHDSTEDEYIQKKRKEMEDERG